MTPQTSAKTVDPTAEAVQEEAISWYLRLHTTEARDDDRSQHMDWLLADPRHIQAYETVCGRMQAAARTEPVARTAFAFAFLKHPPRIFTSLRSYMRTGLFWPRAAFAFAFVAAALFFGFQKQLPFYHADVTRHYAAPAQAMLAVRLADGSKVTLGAGTRIAVDMAKGRRTVTMSPGRAFFEVRHMADRPFYVNTTRRQVRVVGTRFEIADTGADDTITVAEGFVSVCRLKDGMEKAALPSVPVLLEAGMRLHYPAGSDTPTVSRVEAAQVGDWTQPAPDRK
ncbi:FecR family protein [Kordiimonas marina]|uniref:FecR family protein n=1 Tax=Kordiimonas marina TaxID=2872312 RepID=UPI001FF1FF7D|nr:FecR domain-containing protein [Kordiimonas marina]MCJ9429629.1 FecR domain-containing protein [Kordiimonas marina]